MTNEFESGQGPEDADRSAVTGQEAAAAGTGGETAGTTLEEERARAEKYLVNWQRAEADMANYKRRTEQDRADLVRFSNAGLIGKLLPVLDDFERALSAIPKDQRSSVWVEGIRLIDRKISNTLEQEGVTVIEALGKEFDPYVHEAVMREEGEGDVDVVVAELQKGYKLHDRVVRPAMVKVGRRSGKE